MSLVFAISYTQLIVCLFLAAQADYAVPLFFLGLVATAVGQYGTDYLIKKVTMEIRRQHTVQRCLFISLTYI